MAEYLIQGETLDAIADAINAKTGGSSAMTPAQMVTEIEGIPSGGGDDQLLARLKNTLTVYRSTETFTFVAGAFRECTALKTLFTPNATAGFEFVRGSGVETIVIGSPAQYSQTLMRASHLTTADIKTAPHLAGQLFAYDSALTTLILRQTSGVVPLNNVSAFQSTPFASGGAGGTIYIPKALYDHLGDGSSLDYKAATNWSTVDGYGTITWAQIEGSQYENYYADGTPIPSE